MSDDTSWNEKRRFPRVSVHLVIAYRPVEAAKSAKIRQDTLMSLGEGGGFIQTKLTYPKETRLDVQFNLEGKPIKAVVSVRYAVPFQLNIQVAQFPGMGVQFEEIDSSMAKRIRAYVSREQIRQVANLTTG